MNTTLKSHQTKALNIMAKHPKGCVYVPTGGGKTICMIADAFRQLENTTLPKTIIVVAPRILLAQQLCSEFLTHIKNVEVLHVHSAETEFKSTTKTDVIDDWHSTAQKINSSLLHTIHYIRLLILASMSIQYILMKHITQYKEISLMLYHTSQDILLESISLLLHLSTLDQQITREV